LLRIVQAWKLPSLPWGALCSNFFPILKAYIKVEVYIEVGGLVLGTLRTSVVGVSDMNQEEIQRFVRKSYLSPPKYREAVVNGVPIAGLPENYKEIQTLKDLLEIGYKEIDVKEQVQRNLIAKRRAGENPCPGIIGYDEDVLDVIPSLYRALLAGHNINFVGEVGQAKTRLAETIARELLSPTPAIAGCIIHDNPLSVPLEELLMLLEGEHPPHSSLEFHICSDCEERIIENGLDTPIRWVEGKERYQYVLATPDISVKDLVGYIDAVRMTKKGTEIYSLKSYSPGRLLEARYGILCIDELPVLDPRRQVVLLSVLQEGKFTTGTYPVIFKPKLLLIATANPIDYTHVGRFIEPLEDRIETHIRTHYLGDAPWRLASTRNYRKFERNERALINEMLIVLQEASPRIRADAFVPLYILEIVTRIVQMARVHPDIDKARRVSIRMAIHSLEVVVSEAERTRYICYDKLPIPRVCEIPVIHQVSKIKLGEIEDTEENRRKLLDEVIKSALREVSLNYLKLIAEENIKEIADDFAGGKVFEVSSLKPSCAYNNRDAMKGCEIPGEDYVTQLEGFPALKRAAERMMDILREKHERFEGYAKLYGVPSRLIHFSEPVNDELIASITELILEGLYWMEPPILEKKEEAYIGRS